MDYVTVSRAKKALCYSIPETDSGDCTGCPIWDLAIERGMSCGKYVEDYPERVELVVMDWMRNQAERE